MGKKSSAKKKLRPFKQANVTFHKWTEGDKEYEIQEIHPSGTDPSTEEMVKGMSLIAKSGPETFDGLMQMLIKALPKRRFYVITPREFVLGETPILVATYPALTEGQTRRIKDGIESIRKQKGLTT